MPTSTLRRDPTTVVTNLDEHSDYEEEEDEQQRRGSNPTAGVNDGVDTDEATGLRLRLALENKLRIGGNSSTPDVGSEPVSSQRASGSVAASPRQSIHRPSSSQQAGGEADAAAAAVAPAPAERAASTAQPVVDGNTADNPGTDEEVLSYRLVHVSPSVAREKPIAQDDEHELDNDDDGEEEDGGEATRAKQDSQASPEDSDYDVTITRDDLTRYRTAGNVDSQAGITYVETFITQQSLPGISGTFHTQSSSELNQSYSTTRSGSIAFSNEMFLVAST